MNRQYFIDVLAAGRVANLPSVVSNVVFGSVTGSWLLHLGGLNLFWPSVTGCLLYLGGCFLNDWNDRNWDRENKPERAIPSGRLSSTRVLFLAVGFLLSGIVLSFLQTLLAGFVALLITFCILVYTWIHKRTALGIVPMGLCRGGLYFLGLASQTLPEQVLKGETKLEISSLVSLFPAMLLPAFGLVSFIAGLSLLARYEARGVVGSWKKRLAFLLLVAPGFALGTVSLPAGVLGVGFFLLIALWGSRLLKHSISKGVSFLLAGICLVDLGSLLILQGFSSSWSQAGLLPFAALSGVAFLLALLLQRIAPAT